MKRPSLQFYPSDWMNDPALRCCSMAARGLWIDMLCLMHNTDIYGHLIVAGKPISAQELSRLVGESIVNVKKWLSELKSHDVFSVTKDGIIFSRRMLRDEIQRDEWRKRQACHRDVTPMSRSTTSTSTSSSSITNNPLPPKGGEEEVGKKLVKWFRGMQDVNNPTALAKKYLTLYSKEIILATLKDGACTDRSNFIKIANFKKSRK